MSTLTKSAPRTPDATIPPWPLKRFTVEEYHRLIRTGGLNEDDRIELLDGWLVEKIPKNPPHEGTIMLLHRLIQGLLPLDWDIRIQSAIETQGSEPEPDLAVVKAAADMYLSHHPQAKEIALLIEVSDTTVDTDREKRLIYARAGIPVYWIVNLEDRCLEVYTEPRGRGRTRDYASRQQLGLHDSVTLRIAGKSCGNVPVSDMIKIRSVIARAVMNTGDDRETSANLITSQDWSVLDSTVRRSLDRLSIRAQFPNPDRQGRPSTARSQDRVAANLCGTSRGPSVNSSDAP